MRAANHPDRPTILVVCYGNLCRSPVAEALFRDRLGKGGFSVLSAGTHAVGGDPPSLGAQRAIESLAGLDIAAQRSQPLTVELLERANHVFTMSRRQALEAAALFPGAASRTRLLGAFAPSPHEADVPADPFAGPAGPLEIPDPMGADPEAYTACTRRLIAAIDAVCAWLGSGAEAAGAPAPVATWPEYER